MVITLNLYLNLFITEFSPIGKRLICKGHMFSINVTKLFGHYIENNLVSLSGILKKIQFNFHIEFHIEDIIKLVSWKLECTTVN